MAVERRDLRVHAMLRSARKRGVELVTTSPVVGQVWRNGRRQPLLASLVASTRIDAPDAAAARRAGELLAQSGTRDVVDALLVGIARHGDTIVTSDVKDIELLAAAAGIAVEIFRA